MLSTKHLAITVLVAGPFLNWTVMEDPDIGVEKNTVGYPQMVNETGAPTTIFISFNDRCSSCKQLSIGVNFSR